jgi:peroxiredoxin
MTDASRPLDFSLSDHQGGTYRLSDELAKRSVVVVFYRGDW